MNVFKLTPNLTFYTLGAPLKVFCLMIVYQLNIKVRSFESSEKVHITAHKTAHITHMTKILIAFEGTHFQSKGPCHDNHD